MQFHKYIIVHQLLSPLLPSPQIRLFIFPSFQFSETKVSDKKKLSEKIKERENRLKKKQQELEENVSFYPHGFHS